MAANLTDEWRADRIKAWDDHTDSCRTMARVPGNRGLLLAAVCASGGRMASSWSCKCDMSCEFAVQLKRCKKYQCNNIAAGSGEALIRSRENWGHTCIVGHNCRISWKMACPRESLTAFEACSIASLAEVHPVANPSACK